MKKQRNSGFTLIELLMVIAIIGFLAAIVVTSLVTARNRGADAAVKSNLSSLRSIADLYYDSNGESYGTFSVSTCPTTVTNGNVFSNQTVINAINAAVSAGQNGSYCVATGASYAVAVGLKTSGKSWCVDSRGTSRQVESVPSSAITSGTCN